MTDLSVIIPVRDEEENIPELVARLTKTITGMDLDYELIFVTDINRDKTYETILSHHELDEKVKAIKLSNSFGQHVAVMAGLELCSGSAVVVMDGDLQDSPEDIPLLYAEMKRGYSIVYGVKEKKNETILKNLSSKLFVRLLNRLSDYDIRYNTCMFRIMNRKAVDELLRFKEAEPSLTFLMGLINLATSNVEVSSGKRYKGRTKYNFYRQVNLAISSLLSFSTKPLRLISICGLFVSLLSMIYLIVVLIQKIVFKLGIIGWPTLVSLILLLGGLQLFGMGIIGEYIGRIFIQSKNRPRYIIEKTTGDLK